jgi:hypothetical protein
MDFSIQVGTAIPTFPQLNTNGSHINFAANFDGTGVHKSSNLSIPNSGIMHVSSNLDLEGMNTQYNTFNAQTSITIYLI